MGFLGAVLAVLAWGCVLGLWTASTVLREGRAAYEDGTPEPLTRPATQPIAVVLWTPERSR